MAKEKPQTHLRSGFGAGDEARTRYLHLGKVALYRMSYARGTWISIAKPQSFVKGLFAIFHVFIL